MQQIENIARMELDFVDLTLEPPGAASWLVDPLAIRAALDRLGLQAVGHTAYYLPLASAIDEIRAAAVMELKRCIEVFGEIGVPRMNVHPDRPVPMHPRAFSIQRNLQSLQELLPHAERCGVGLMIENLPGAYNTAAQLGEFFGPMPELGLHLDLGHANLEVVHNTTEEILAAHGARLRHVHLHDNKGGRADLHLPLGTGNVDVPAGLRALQRIGYDGTVTLEVFSPDQNYLIYSRDRLRAMWSATA
jgi:sugar phosphate isomerase/epimerase